MKPAERVAIGPFAWRAGVTILFGVAVALFMRSAKRSETPYLMVDDLVPVAASLEGHEVRAHGWVVAGSIAATGHGLTFVLHKGGKEIRVFGAWARPDTFKDQSEVVIRGRVVQLGGDYVLDSDEILMKCTVKYEGTLPRPNATPFQ